jgi:uncharacterized protein with HEPN domain
MWRDDAWLLDMLHACEHAHRYTTGVSGAAFLADEMRQDAILRQLTILGEAAKQVSAEYRAAHPEISWQKIAGFRDVVVHQYFRVHLPEVWRIVTEDLVGLQRNLESLVPPQEEKR